MSSQGQDLARVMGCMPISGTDSHRAQNKNFCASYPIVLRVPTLLHLTTVAMDCHTTKQTKTVWLSLLYAALVGSFYQFADHIVLNKVDSKQ